MGSAPKWKIFLEFKKSYQYCRTLNNESSHFPHKLFAGLSNLYSMSRTVFVKKLTVSQNLWMGWFFKAWTIIYILDFGLQIPGKVREISLYQYYGIYLLSFFRNLHLFLLNLSEFEIFFFWNSVKKWSAVCQSFTICVHGNNHGRYIFYEETSKIYITIFGQQPAKRLSGSLLRVIEIAFGKSFFERK